MYKYIAYDADTYEYEEFKTYEEAEKWILNQDYSEGVSPEVMEGKSFIAKIIARTSFKETDRIENYPCLKNPANPAECSECEKKDCEGTEEWPYPSEFDYVGEVVLKSEKITENESKIVKKYNLPELKIGKEKNEIK